MADKLTKYISSDGKILVPINSNTHPDLVDDAGVYYLAQTRPLLEGGLLLAISYPTG